MMNPSLISWTLDTINSPLNTLKSPYDLLERISELQTLPVLPGVAMRIIQLAADLTADAEKLAAVIELDPLLTAQILRWASSSLYGYPGKIVSVREAISRVLGFDLVFNLALGLSTIGLLKAPKDGPIGTRFFWVHAMTSSLLMPLLNSHIPLENRFQDTELCLAALLHNIGYPLLGDQFPREFTCLNHLMAANPTLSEVALESFTLGVSHDTLGAWLMTSWSMPKPIIDVVYHHHNPGYRGDNYRLNLLTYLNDCLLGGLGIGNGKPQIYTEEILAELHLPVTAINQSLEKLGDKFITITDQVDGIIG